ncbi:hypothetical protein NB697_002417 [Xanthomonas sacchari]|nr:hypothetical protein [Xanthomonas sacchari]MCW0405366.1 hypothetical protein [Xanthomonas sacchari]MCW0449759.1 hypothetical protein [Xanthomonas sacchari]
MARKCLFAPAKPGNRAPVMIESGGSIDRRAP